MTQENREEDILKNAVVKKSEAASFSVKLLLWIVFILGTTLSTVVTYLMKRNESLVQSRDEANRRCDQEKQDIWSQKELRIQALSLYKDSIIESKNQLINSILQEKMITVKSDINKLNKELK